MKPLLSPEQFYYDLQNSRLSESAFEEWSAYRRQVTDFLLSNSKQENTLAIFGAGRCNDIDLKRLSEQFSEITLVDINKASMQAAIREYGLAGCAGIKTAVRDFVGIADQDYINYIASILGSCETGCVYPDSDKTDFPALFQLDRMYEKARGHSLNLGNKQYDCSLTLNVHSQLNDMAEWIRAEIADRGRLSPAEHLLLTRRIAVETERLIKKFNDAVFAATKELVFIGYETGLEGHISKEIEGAIQTRDDLKAREKNGQIRSVRKTPLIWPYHKKGGTVFSVQLESFTLQGEHPGFVPQAVQ